MNFRGVVLGCDGLSLSAVPDDEADALGYLDETYGFFFT